LQCAPLVDPIGAGLVDCDRVFGNADADIVDDRRVGMAVAIAGRGNLGDEIGQKASDDYWITQIQKPHIDKVAAAETLP